MSVDAKDLLGEMREAFEEASVLASEVGKTKLESRYKRLAAKIHQLEKQLDDDRSRDEIRPEGAELEFRENAYWKGEDGPFCPNCWDGEKKLMRLTGDDGYYSCRCKFMMSTKEAQEAADRLFYELNKD